MSTDDFEGGAWGAVLGLMVHDLRNPGATIGANLSFLTELGPRLSGVDEDVGEAVSDMVAALGDLRRGLDHLSWIARWMDGRPALPVADGDAAAAVDRAAARAAQPMRVDVTERPLRARGGGTLAQLLDILVANSRVHARGGECHLRAWREGASVVVEVRDQGPAIHPELREAAFTMEGQVRIKTRPDGRYGQAGALLAARALADAMGASLEAGGEEGDAWFRIGLVAL
jgi:signal transduction histidine kinase